MGPWPKGSGENQMQQPVPLVNFPGARSERQILMTAKSLYRAKELIPAIDEVLMLALL